MPKKRYEQVYVAFDQVDGDGSEEEDKEDKELEAEKRQTDFDNVQWDGEEVHGGLNKSERND
jgi:hypothetical protein